ncbi:hypothetical protein C8Q73DRAFT_538934 [Cubamyces lactineus]|nr:hypothetical protein C8Q73DRAFT_538934 [Cubamyces lactineus]
MAASTLLAYIRKLQAIALVSHHCLSIFLAAASATDSLSARPGCVAPPSPHCVSQHDGKSGTQSQAVACSMSSLYSFSCRSCSGAPVLHLLSASPSSLLRSQCTLLVIRLCLPLHLQS